MTYTLVINNLPAAINVAPATSLDKFKESHIISRTGTKYSSQMLPRAKIRYVAVMTKKGIKN